MRRVSKGKERKEKGNFFSLRKNGVFKFFSFRTPIIFLIKKIEYRKSGFPFFFFFFFFNFVFFLFFQPKNLFVWNRPPATFRSNLFWCDNLKIVTFYFLKNSLKSVDFMGEKTFFCFFGKPIFFFQFFFFCFCNLEC